MFSRNVRFSVILPVATTPPGFADTIAAYGRGMTELGGPFELVLVASAESAGACTALTGKHEWLRTCDPGGYGWGRAVRAGLAASAGEIVCYTNWQRTSVAALTEILGYALSNHDIVFRANRRTRDTFRQRIGSLLFNLECRALLGTTAWDVNGTPKAFSRQRSRLLELQRGDDLIDAEFAAVCEREGYPVAEIPITAELVAGESPKPDYVAAVRMYAGVVALRRR